MEHRMRSKIYKINGILGYAFLGIGIMELILIIFQGKNYWEDVCVFFTASGINLLGRQEINFKGARWLIAILFVILVVLVTNKIFM